MRKKKQENINPTEIETALSSVLQPRFSRMTNDLGFYSAWIAYVAINFQKVLSIFPLQIKPLETVCSWEIKKEGMDNFL